MAMVALLFFLLLFQIELTVQVGSSVSSNFYSSCINPNSFSFIFLSKEATFEFVQSFISKELPTYKFSFFVQNNWFQEEPAYFQSRVWDLHSLGHTIGLSIEGSLVSTFNERAVKRELRSFEEFTGFRVKFISAASVETVPTEFLDWCKRASVEFVHVPIQNDVHTENSTFLANFVGTVPFVLVDRDTFFIDEQNTNFILNSIRLIESMHGRVESLNECLAVSTSSKFMGQDNEDNSNNFKSNKSNNETNKSNITNKPNNKSNETNNVDSKPKVTPTGFHRQNETKKTNRKFKNVNQKNKAKKCRFNSSSYIEIFPISTKLESDNVAYVQDKSVRTLGIRKYKYVKEFDTSGEFYSKFSIGIPTIVLILCILFN